MEHSNKHPKKVNYILLVFLIPLLIAILFSCATTKCPSEICYDCCAENDAKQLKELSGKEKMLLYWDGRNITNWPGSLKITPSHKTKGKHNIAGVREDIYFNFEGNQYHATQYGNMSQIAHIRKVATKH